MIANDLMSIWTANGRDISPHLKSILNKLSSEHISGISLAQLDSPMMKQYRQAKDEAPDALLFFRMGDFYELFGVDAVIVSDLCGLTLTSRDKNSANPVPMAGAPVVGYKNHLKKCLQAGFKVAICDQVEDPKQAKGIVRREITRIATPAVPGDLEDENSQGEASYGCYLVSVLNSKKYFTLSLVDVSTGEFRATGKLSEQELFQELATLRPKEILCSSNTEKIVREQLKQLGFVSSIYKIENWILNSEHNAMDLFCEFFQEDDFHRFGLSSIDCGLASVVSILFYLKATQKNILKNIQLIQIYQVHNYLSIDDSTKKHLDFFSTSHGEKKGSLFYFLNQCFTAVGSRHLFRLLNYPFKDKNTIEKKLNFVQWYIENPIVLHELVSQLKQTADLEKLLSRAAQKSLDPKGMAWLRNTLSLLPSFVDQTPPNFEHCDKSCLEILSSLFVTLSKSLAEDPVNMVGKGGVIFRSGYCPQLDELVELETNFNTKLEELEKFERERSQIPTLKIGYTRVFGYYFEVSKGKLGSVPSHFMRKQTLTNGERFVTQELKELEEKALSASEQRVSLEKELLEKLNLEILSCSKELLLASVFIGALDILANFSFLSLEHNWVKPEIIDENKSLLNGLVHPILAKLTGGNFVSNDVCLSDIHLITGPNMAGKSTLMRQVALAQILCQIGCFVPAQSAQLGLVDRILTRIGSADHALKNQSTFMVEMLETANLLRLASEKSLLLLDEIGRGTSTYDGVSLAWSILEYLHDRVKARTLFSTHYHELSGVCETRSQITPMQMAVEEKPFVNENGEMVRELVFSRHYIPGCAGKSYGIQVAKRAGIPEEILERAGQILHNLEENKQDARAYIEEKRRSKKARAVVLPEQTLF